ncbi:MAG: HAD family hydrolase [Chloroflexi bacterium]|nr:HAD family hydrolase [Chloroflexota bacterium]MYF21192.1 HAD family hydrolase [Chloroflexota bacterium]
MPPPHLIRAVALDLWGTLIADAPGGGRRRMQRRERMLRTAYEQAGAGDAAAEAVPVAIRDAIQELVAAHQSNVDLSGEDRINAVRRSMLRQCPNTVESPELLTVLAEAIGESASWEPPEIIGGVEAELDCLKQHGLRLAVVSNTGLAPGRRVEAALVARGFDRWIDHWIWSDEVLSWKPGQAIFTAALDALDVTAEQAAFVGDTPEADILGARHADFAASVQVGGKRDPSILPDIHLPSLAGLSGALQDAGLLHPDP